MDTYKQDFAIEDGVLLVRLSGQFPSELLDKEKNLFAPLIEACSTHRCRKALIDAVHLRVDLDTMGLFRAGADVAAAECQDLQIAIVTTEDAVDRFFEDVAVNRGGDVRVFTDLDAARAWLQTEGQVEPREYVTRRTRPPAHSRSDP